MKSLRYILVGLLAVGAFTAAAANAQDANTSWANLCGIGAKLEPQGDSVMVNKIIPGGGAQKAGLPEGSQIISVDGKPVKGMALQDVINLIRGAEGTVVSITVMRGSGVNKTYAITRSPLNGNSVGLGLGHALPRESSSKQIIFKSDKKAPSDFNAWTFFWKAPSRDPDAKLEYVVIRPDGTEYFKFDVSHAIAGEWIRSDFGRSNGGDPAVFFNQHITIIFRVSKGDLSFDSNAEYCFEYRKIEQPPPSPRSTSPAAAQTPPSNRKFQWFGYSVFGKPSDIAEIATYSNFIWLRDWTKNGDRDQFAEAARRSGIKLVLEIPEKQGWNDIKDSAGPFIAKHRDVVAAICWNCPSFNGWTPEQLAKDARRLKQAFPELQCWVECVEFPRGKLDTKPVPPEMDVIVVNDFFDTKPKDVRKKTEAALPGWISKANGRPVLLQWFGIGYAAWNKPDGVALSRPETMRMCAEVAKEFGLAGLVFFYYGDAPERVEGNRGIETNPALVEEIKAIAKEGGFSRVGSPLAPLPSLPASGGIQPEANQSLAKTLSQQAPNATDWVLAPLDQSVPADIRRNLTVLREDLLDEAKDKPAAGPEAYAIGRQLCDTLIAVLDERDATLVRMGFRAAQANANTRVTSQALEARRNYMMSWPQYAREKDQAGEIFRQQTNVAALTKELPKVEWSNRTAVLRKILDALYAKYREALRQGKK